MINYDDPQLVSVLKSNEIDDLPPPNTRTHHRFEVPEEIQMEITRTKEMREGEFRKWLIKNKPKKAVMLPVEVSTAVGVPDIYSCYDGCQIWLECKIAMTGPAHIRGTQFAFFTKLLEAGGKGRLVVQRLEAKTYKPSAVEIYNVEEIVTIPLGLFKKQGQELILPARLKPWYKWKYKRDKNVTIDDLYLHLLLDTDKFTC